VAASPIKKLKLDLMETVGGRKATYAAAFYSSRSTDDFECSNKTPKPLTTHRKSEEKTRRSIADVQFLSEIYLGHFTHFTLIQNTEISLDF